MKMNRDTTQVSRRNFMGMAAITPFALTGSSLLSLTAYAGGSSNAAPYAVKLKFNASTNPTTAAQRAAVFTDASVDITYSDGAVKNSKLSFVALYKSGDTLKKPPAKGGGDVIAGGYTKLDGVTAILDTDNNQMFSDCFDGQSLIKLSKPTVSGISGNTLFMVTQFEYKSQNAAGTSMYGKLPSPISVTTLDQNTSTGALTVKYYYNIPTKDIHGLWIPCAGSLSPWNTHLSSEEYEPDAWLVKMRKDKGSALTTTDLPAPVSGSTDGWTPKQLSIANRNLAYFFDFSRQVFDTSATTDAGTSAKPYNYGHVPEVTVNPDGTAHIKKHYCLGRISRELVQVMPDNKTVLMGDDYVGGGLFMFIADIEKDLSAGTLYAAKLTQDASVATKGGKFAVSWIKLGKASSDDIHNAVNKDNITTDQIIDVKFTEPSDSTYTKLTLDGLGTQWVKVINGKDKEAAFLETHRYASIKGATLELTKLEGVTLNMADKLAYFAISRIDPPMGDSAGSVKLTASRPGAVYASQLSGSKNDTDSNAISSEWVPTDFYVPEGLYGESLTAADSDGNLANIDKIAQPDNVKFSEKMRTLFIGEDGSGHLNNYLWAYNVDTQLLSKVLSLPAGAESASLQAVDNVNGFSYVMTGFQHAGDLSYNSSTGTGTLNGKTVPADLMSAIISQWGGVNKKSAVGYISGLPLIA
jgi:secreted PhoX family phosphatase